MKRLFVIAVCVSVYMYVLRRYWDSGFISGYVAGHCDGELTERVNTVARDAINKAKERD